MLSLLPLSYQCSLFPVFSVLVIWPTLYLILCSNMAAFSYQNQYPPSLIDLSPLFPNSSINSTPSCFPNISSCQEIQQNTDSSSIVEASGDQGTQKMTTMGMKRGNKDGSCLSSLETKDSKRGRGKKQRSCVEAENKMKLKKDSAKAAQTGYVHVRARRGEATDSHSLAERVRRERISERLKMLQSLVPGCDKVTSKALMLDEIINYVQALQHQVEFLSMKLASTGPMFYDFNGQNTSSIVKPEAQQSLPQADITTTANNYPFIDSSVAYLLQQEEERPIDFYQEDNVNLLWSTIDEQRQRLCNQSYFPNLSSFH